VRSDQSPKRKAASSSAFAALILCAILLAGLMPLSIARVEIADRDVQPSALSRVAELLPEPPDWRRLHRSDDDASPQTRRLFDRLRALNAQKKRLSERAAQPDLQLDEFP
jgi:hypothetical protein